MIHVTLVDRATGKAFGHASVMRDNQLDHYRSAGIDVVPGWLELDPPGQAEADRDAQLGAEADAQRATLEQRLATLEARNAQLETEVKALRGNKP